MDININNLTDEQIADIERQLAERKKVKNQRRWKPCDGEKYDSLDSGGMILDCAWLYRGGDEARWEQGNVFKPGTGDAEKEIERRRLETAILDRIFELKEERGGFIDLSDVMDVMKEVFSFNRKGIFSCNLHQSESPIEWLTTDESVLKTITGEFGWDKIAIARGWV